MNFNVPANYKVKLKEREKRDKYLDLARELKNYVTLKVTVIPTVIGALGTVTKAFGTGTEGLGYKRTSRDHPNYSVLGIGQNTEKSPEDLRRLAVTQIPTLMGKTLKE